MDPNQQQQARRRAVEAGGGGQNHPAPQPCPRCASNNTKFCYFNNYSLSQPRFFCKGCRRYWTQGGTLRNVPVGGGCRKSKRPKLASTSPTSGTGSDQSQLLSLPSHLNQPLILNNAQDQRMSMMTNNNNSIITTSTTSNNNNNVGAMMMGHSFYGGGSPGFLSSLAAIQGMNNQPMSFGPNLGLLHGFGLANYDHQQVQQPNNQEVSLPSLYSTREVGSSSTPSMQEWNLRMGTGPGSIVDPRPATTNVVDNNNNNSNRNQDKNDNSPSNQQWSNFMGTNGLDDP